MTTRQLANKVRSLFSGRPEIKVTGKTVSFSGFGYDSGFFIKIHTPTRLTSEEEEKVRALGHLADNDTKVIYELSGPAYLFGGTVH